MELAEHEEALRCRHLSMLQSEISRADKQTADIDEATSSVLSQLRSVEARRIILRDRIRVNE